MADLRAWGFAAVAGLFAAAPAVAQESPFSGPFVGAEIGYIDYYDTEVPFDGFNYGIVVGYSDVNQSGLYGAVEAEFMLSSAEASEAGVTLSVERTIAVNLMLGQQVGQNAVLYGKFGGVSTTLEGSVGSISDQESFEGFRLGAGGEYAFGNGFSLRSEAEFDFLSVNGVDLDSLIVGIGLIKRF